MRTMEKEIETIKQTIGEQGRVVDEEFLDVSGFLNHRVQPFFIELVAEILVQRFGGGQDIDTVLTAEAAGNIIAYEIAMNIGVPALYARKSRLLTMKDPICRFVNSPTQDVFQHLCVPREYLKGMRVLVVNDFLFSASTAEALGQMVVEARGKLVGFGFVIRKFREGLERLSREFPDVPIETVVNIAKLAEGRVVFED